MDKLSIKLQEMFNQIGIAALHPINGIANIMHGPASAKPAIRQKKLPHAGAVATRRPAYDTDRIAVWNLLSDSANNDLLTDAYAWVIATCCNPTSSPFIPALGLDPAAFTNLLARRFPHFVPPQRWLAAQDKPASKSSTMNEFPGLLQLLLDHCASPDEHHRNVAHLIAAACMGDGLLWHDLGLPDREALSAMFCRHFPTLAEKNIGDAQLKTFFYQQLCEREGITAYV